MVKAKEAKREGIEEIEAEGCAGIEGGEGITAAGSDHTWITAIDILLVFNNHIVHSLRMV